MEALCSPETSVIIGQSKRRSIPKTCPFTNTAVRTENLAVLHSHPFSFSISSHAQWTMTNDLSALISVQTRHVPFSCATDWGTDCGNNGSRDVTLQTKHRTTWPCLMQLDQPDCVYCGLVSLGVSHHSLLHNPYDVTTNVLSSLNPLYSIGKPVVYYIALLQQR